MKTRFPVSAFLSGEYMKIDLDRPFKTKSGNTVKIHSISGEDKNFPLVGEVQLLKDDWSLSKWSTSGECATGKGVLDLENTKKKVTAVVALVRSVDTGDIYCPGSFGSVEELTAWLNCYKQLITLVGRKEVTLVEGEYISNASNTNI